MDLHLRVVTRLPLGELWRSDGTIIEDRTRGLEAKDIAESLRIGSIEFVVADVGQPLNWIAPDIVSASGRQKLSHAWGPSAGEIV
jgi:hypothetical protein